MSTGCQYNLSCASSYVFLTWTDVLGRAFVISVLFSRENSWKWSRQTMTSNSGGGLARPSLPRCAPPAWPQMLKSSIAVFFSSHKDASKFYCSYRVWNYVGFFIKVNCHLLKFYSKYLYKLCFCTISSY